MSDILDDATGFPMLRVDAIDAHIHWLPVTKIQFEYFLCDRPSSQFDQDWYSGILHLNARVSPQQITRKNYWETFITGIRPDEARAFADWCGEQDGAEYSLPTGPEWFKAYQTLKSEAARTITQINTEKQRERTRKLLAKIDNAVRERPKDTLSLADQMLMRDGVMEWVATETDKRPWAAFGQPNKTFFANLYTPDTGQPQIPNDYEQRLRSHGFRLLRRSA